MIRNNPYKKIYGLTGSIGSGKSTAAQYFRELGAVVIDADALAKEIYTSQYDQYNKVIYQLQKKIEPHAQKLLHASIFHNNNDINRITLGNLIFTYPKMRKILNKITHKHIRRLFRKKIEVIEQNKVIIYDIPLLFEGRLQDMFKKTILVYSSEDICLQRIIDRNQLTLDEAKKRLNSQMSIEEKKLYVDYLIDNQKDMLHLRSNVENVWQELSKSKV